MFLIAMTDFHKNLKILMIVIVERLARSISYVGEN